MADYYPLILKAVAGLNKNTGEVRRALYERARTALRTQLHGLKPPLSQSDITREQLTLEEAIRKVEAETARNSRVGPPPRNPFRVRGLRNSRVDRPLPTPFTSRESREQETNRVLRELQEALRTFQQENPQIERELEQARVQPDREDPLLKLRELAARLEVGPDEVLRKREEEKARLLREQEEALRLREEEKARLLREQEEALRLREEEKARLLREQEEALRLREEEKARLLREQEEALRLREEEKARLLHEQEETLRKRELEVRRVSRARLAEVASPAPSLAPDGRLDAGPNATYDVPGSGIDLPTLPIRQRALIDTILSDLPRNAPRHLKASLENYSDELKVRGVQPILGLLQDMAGIIDASVRAPNAEDEWLEAGMRAAFKILAENHALFVRHFPLDPEREEIYAQTPINENVATGPTLSKPFEDVAKASLQAKQASLTTDDFLRIVDKMAEYAKVISTLPPVSQSSGETQHQIPIPFPIVGPEDKTLPNTTPVTPKKRMLLSGFGFFERAYNLLGSTATLLGPAEGNVLLQALRDAIAALSKLIFS